MQLCDKGENIDWSTRLLRTLNNVETEFVITILDDEFLFRPVDEAALQKTIEILKRDKRIASILFAHPWLSGGIASKLYKNFNVIKRTKPTQHSANAAIWRKKKLVSYLKEGESIWEFETRSRTRRALFDRCYAFKYGKAPLWVVPSIGVNGYGIVQGRWMWKTKDWLKEYGIEIEETRGVFTEEEAKVKMAEHFRKKKELSEAPFCERVVLKLHRLKTSMPPKLRRALGIIKRLGKRKVVVEESCSEND